MNKSPLGRGLSSLISSNPLPQENTSQDTTKQPIQTVRVELISPNPYQPRKHFEPEELASLTESIRDHGILQPLVVTSKGDGTYELIAGERRLRASREAGLIEVPVTVRENVSDQGKAELALIENIQRKDLNPLDKAQGFYDLQQEFGLTQEEIAKKLDISRSVVANTLRYLTLPTEVKQALIDGLITEGHAKIIAGLPTEQQQQEVLNNIVKNALNVRQTEKVVKQQGGLVTEVPQEVKAWMGEISQAIHNKVEVRKKGERYIVTINLFGEKDIEDFYKRFR